MVKGTECHFLALCEPHCPVLISDCCCNYPHNACCRLMDRMQQKQISTEPCGPKVQPGPCALIRAGQGLRPELAIRDPPLISPSEVLKKQPGLSPMQSAVAPMKLTEQMHSGQPKSGSTSATLASISRPRPTALGTKPTPKMTRISVDPSKEIDLIPVCIPGPQSSTVLPHSPTESSFSLHSPQSPHSPQSYTSQPYLSPNPSLCPKPSLCPQPLRSPSPGSSTQSQAQSEKPGENNDFRWDKWSRLYI